MTWDESDEAHRVLKFMKNGLLEPEDLRPNEFRLLKEHYPHAARFVRAWLEERAEMIERGEWTDEYDPPDRERRIARYERGEGLVDPHDAE